MYDDRTNSLWHHMTGEPVVGPLAQSGIRLRVLPVVVLPWREWRGAHPATRVVDIQTGHRRDYRPGRPYGAYFASPDTMFPVSPRSAELLTKAVVLAVRVGGAAKIFPLEVFAREPVVNDRVGGTDVVVVGRADSRGARAYARGRLRFEVGGSPNELVEVGRGVRWRVEEEQLVNPTTGETRPRLGAHLVYWFGWHAFYPDAELYHPRR
jgi:hypothetical protein